MNSPGKQFIKWYVRYDLKLLIVSTSMVEGLKLKAFNKNLKENLGKSMNIFRSNSKTTTLYKTTAPFCYPHI